MTLQKIRFS